MGCLRCDHINWLIKPVIALGYLKQHEGSFNKRLFHNIVSHSIKIVLLKNRYFTHEVCVKLIQSANKVSYVNKYLQKKVALYYFAISPFPKMYF